MFSEEEIGQLIEFYPIILKYKVFKNFIIRNPNSSRPWQHVLDVINGYLILAMKLYKNRENIQVIGFGPNYKKNVT